MWGHETTAKTARRLGRTLLLATALCSVAGGSAAIAQAQQAAGERSFAIPAGKLAEALVQFGYQSGLQVAADGQLTAAATTRGVSGHQAPAEALSRLLAGTGLTYRFTAAGTVQLEPAPQATGETITLGPIQVEGRNATPGLQSLAGQVAGYVANQAVSATKTATTLAETPQSISVMTRGQMDDQAAQTIPQALRYTASTFDERNGADVRYDYLSARGFALDQYLNGLKLIGGDYSMPQIDLFNLDRIEVLRGPASVLYGQVSPGGMVNYIGKLPTPQPYHDVEFQTGSYGRTQGAFDFAGPFDEGGEVLYRLTGIGSRADTQVDHTRQSRLSVSPAVTWRPSDDTTVTLLSTYQYDPDGGFYYQLPAAGTVLPGANGRIPTDFFSGDPNFDSFHRQQYSVGYLLDHRFDDVWSLHQGFRYGHTDTDIQFLYNTGVSPDQTTITRRADANKDALDAVTLDQNVQAEFSTGPLRHTIIAGFDYQHWTDRETDWDGEAPSIDFLAPVYNQAIAYPAVDLDTAQNQNQYGLYAQDQIRLGRWTVLIGGRQDWADGDTRDFLAAGDTRQSESASTWRAGLVYLFDNGLAPYFSYATSFQPTAGTGFDARPFAPTRGEQEEVGLKYQPSGGNSYFQASFYNLTQNNVLTADPIHTNFSIQTGQVRSRGADLEGKLSLTDGLDATMSYSYLDNVVTRSNTGTLGKTPYGVPRNQVSAWANYRFHDTSLAGLGVGAGVRYVGWSYGASTQTFTVPDYALVDAAIRYDLSHIDARLAGTTLSLNADNLFDKTYVTTCSTANGCYYGLRRTVLATLGVKW